MKKCLKILIFIIAISYIISSNINTKKKDYDLLLEWGKNKSIYISKKIKMNYTNENIRNYYVRNIIKKGEIIMSIPRPLLLTIESALNLLGPRFKRQYNLYRNQSFDIRTSGNDELLSYRINQSFLAYLMTIANKNKSKKNKFYQYYQYFFNTFETDFEKFPIFFSTEQIRFLLFSIFGNDIGRTKKIFEEEYEILQREIYKKILDQDEYFKYRLISFEKFVNISGTCFIIPFVDLIETNPVSFNLEVHYTNENDSLSVIATKDINRKEELKLAVVQMSNSDSLMTYGKIYEESKDYFENFRILKASSDYIKDLGLNPLLADGEVLDLNEDKYYEQVLPFYTELSRMLKEDGSKASALRLFMENMKYIRNNYNKITVSDLYKNFYDPKIVQNIRSILDSEKRYLDKKIREMKKIVNKYALEREKDL